MVTTCTQFNHASSVLRISTGLSVRVLSIPSMRKNKAIPYAYGLPICVWAAHISIRIWDRQIRVWAKIRVRDGTVITKRFISTLPVYQGNIVPKSLCTRRGFARLPHFSRLFTVYHRGMSG